MGRTATLRSAGAIEGAEVQAPCPRYVRRPDSSRGRRRLPHMLASGRHRGDAHRDHRISSSRSLVTFAAIGGDHLRRDQHAVSGTVPLGTYHLGHNEVVSWDPREDPRCVVAYAGLAFSLLTVVGWAAACFGTERRLETAIKAIGFTTLIEALMMTSTATWLSVGCLVLLIAINAVANGCRIAMKSAATGVSHRFAYMPISHCLRCSPRPIVARGNI
jgi:hypothetical protein